MGQYDAFIWVGGALVAGWFIIQNPDIFSNIFPPAGGSDPPVIDDDTGGGDDEEEEGESGSSGSADCKKACSNCWCKTYSEQCGGSCSKCKGGNRVPEKCGLTGESGGEFGEGATTTSSKSEDCKNFCNKGWCESYRARGCTGGCATCSKGGIASPSGSGCPSKVYNSNCAGNCRQTCWHSTAIVNGNQRAVDVCVSKSNACSDARAAFLKKYANVARAYNTYPYYEMNLSNVYS